VVQALLPAVEDQAWFFDTELLLLAERSGLRIHEVPVDWVEDPDSRVEVLRTALDDLRGMVRMGRRLLAGRAGVPVPAGMARQLPRFAAIGVVSTLGYLALYWLLRTWTGPLAANAAALLVSAVANTAANRRWTFGVRDGRARLRHHLEGLAVFGLGLALTSGALWLLDLVAGATGRAVEMVALLAANAAATLLRFILLRSWVFHPGRTRR
jgi:putative flippase GtrA